MMRRGHSLDVPHWRERRQSRGEEIIPVSLGDTLHTLLDGTPLGSRILLTGPATQEALTRAWGGRVVSHCEPVSLVKGVLAVRIREASWRYDIGFRRPALLAALQKEAPGLGVRDLKFVS